MHWIFIGAGNMASSLIGGLIAAGTEAASIQVVDPDANTLSRATSRFNISPATSVNEALSNHPDDSGIVLAVKPHIVEPVCNEIKAATHAAKLVVSVAAGVRSTSMQRWLGTTPIVRCMPNTPALLGLGATALYATENCLTEQRQAAEQLLNTAGITRWVTAEAQLDAITALSGSGPAYFFYLIEHMTAAGIALGLDQDTAETFAIETAFGAASMARSGDDSPATLRENVTSKGGTTAAALSAFNDANTPAIIAKAMQAANDRAVELGDDLAPQGENKGA